MQERRWCWHVFCSHARIVKHRQLFLLVLILAMAACKEQGGIKVHTLAIKGVKSVDTSRLREALVTKQSSKLPWGAKAFFDRSRFETDLKRIQAFYSDRGYPDARVTGFDMKLNEKQDEVDVTITIAEGEPVTLASVEFAGFDVIPPDHLAALKKRVPLAIGRPRDRQLVVATNEMALNELRDHGFPYAKVATKEDAGPGGKRAAVSFAAQPGALARFGKIDVAGYKSVSEQVIRRELAFKPGDLYRRSLVQETQRRLYGMELFQFATVEPLEQEQQPAEVPTRVTVAEGKHHRLRFGGGYGTEEAVRVDTEYHHLNVFGGARTAGAHARWSSLDRGVRADFTQPYFFGPHLLGALEGERWYTFTPAYQSVVTGGKATLTHRGGQNTTWSVSMTSERDDSTVSDAVRADLRLRNSLVALGLNPDTGHQYGTLNAFGADFSHTTADNTLNAHRGYQVVLHGEVAGKLLPGSFNYSAVAADARHYLPIGGTIVLASRIQMGNITPPGGNPALVPFAKRFFLGGATSIRGWGRYEVSPLSEGLPVGGNNMLAFSTEVRAPLVEKIGGVLFLDGGNVWTGWQAIRLNVLRYAVGSGLRYQTPIGPIRFDVGYQRSGARSAGRTTR